VGVEYVSRVPRAPLDGLIDDLYYLEGVPPYARLTLPPMPSALLIVNLGAPFLIRAGTDVETAEYADGCVVTMPTRALEFGYPLRTRSVGVHFKPWGLAPFLPMPAAELCDRPVTVEQVWGRPAIAELRDRLATADGPHEMLTLLEEELQLLERAMTRWLAQLPDELAAGVDPRGSARERGDQVAAVLSASLARQTMLCDLINAQTNVLEHNVSVEVVVQHKRSAIAGIATASDLVRRHVPELGDGARPVSMTTLILAGALSSYCRPSASALAAYEADPTVLELRLDLRTALESAVATLIAGTLARS
jgi:hypothetical protein